MKMNYMNKKEGLAQWINFLNEAKFVNSWKLV